MPTNRRLAAIMFADIVGYTAMMQQDETEGIAKASRFRAVVESLLETYQGELIEMRGDGALCVFGSAVDAVNCGKSIQNEIKSDIPLRIGIHLGDIVQKEGHLFGDAVNVASRIESLGVAGAILISENVHNQVKNKPEFELTSLGKFQFKNVSKALEVFALSNEGFRVPKRGEMKGKLAEDRKQWMLPTALIGLTLVAFALFQLVPDKSVEEDWRQKRVTVLPFENQTMDPSMDVFGRMVSDWLTKGLMNIEGTSVISATNIQQQLNHAGFLRLGGAGSTSFGDRGNKLQQSTGVDLIVEGNYYLVGDSVFVNSKILDIDKGEYIKAFEVHEGKDKAKELLDKLTQDFLGYWATQERDRFAQSPPTYIAYQEYMKGEMLFVENPEQSAKHHHKAYQLDSTFFSPLFSLYMLYKKEGNYEALEEVFGRLESNLPTFSNWEKLRFNIIKATRDRDVLLAAKMSEKLYQLDESDARAYARMIGYYSSINYPQKALALMRSSDKRLVNTPAIITWQPVPEIFANFRIGNHKEVAKIAQEYSLPKTPDALAVMHLKSLIRFGEFNQLKIEDKNYREKGVFDSSGKPTPFGQYISLICDGLYLQGEEEVLGEYVKELETWAQQNVDSPDYYKNIGLASFYKGDIEEALAAWEKEQVYVENFPGWLRYAQELEYISRIGFCYGMIGDTTKAQEKFELIRSSEGEDASSLGAQYYYQSRILASIGKKEEALESLQNALKNNFDFFRPAVYDMDAFLKPLADYQPFIDFLKPKG